MEPANLRNAAGNTSRRNDKMLKSFWEHFDPSSMVVIFLTLALFLLALFMKGFTQEVLLEAGVFLVSVKLILLSHTNSVSAKKMDERLARIQNMLQGIDDRTSRLET
jgi:hypothetical protein